MAASFVLTASDYRAITTERSNRKTFNEQAHANISLTDESS